MSDKKGWIGVDLDGTLAYYDHWRGVDHIGEPIMPMVMRVRQWLADGEDVRIFTARFSPQPDRTPEQVAVVIKAWCLQHLGAELPVTCTKDWGMKLLYDDRCRQVRTNTGELVE